MEYLRIENAFTPHHLLELLKSLEALNNKNLTEQVAIALMLINNPPIIFKEPKP